jgi:NTP pyrophosphatase (non-canonical NTP hydrolase)
MPEAIMTMNDKVTDKSGLALDQYQAQALKADRKPETSLAFPLLGLFGETGTLLSVVKKKQRDTASYIGYAPHVIEEIGDTLWYLAVVAHRGGILLSEIGNNLARGLSDWDQDGSNTDIRFNDLQGPSGGLRQEPTLAFETTLLDLAGEVGTVLSNHQAGRFNDNRASLQGRLVAVLRVLVKAADEAGVTLAVAAEGNLKKIFDRWPLERIYSAPFDQLDKPFERLPRALTIDIIEREINGKLYVFQQCDGINLGDRLTDNAVEPDDYRFHDVFHYAHCAVLTWSPVTRALLRLKRKSKPLVDEVQDGARAILIEEGITTWIFGQAKNLDFFSKIKPGDLSFDMLKAIRQFVAGYEPESCPLWLWEDAILQGYSAFRFLKEKRRARLCLDMSQRKLIVGELQNDA